MLTVSPRCASPRLVRSSVSGISATSSWSSDSALTVRLTPLSATDAVDVTLDDVSAEPVLRAQRQLEVHAGAVGEAPERGALERLVHRLCAEATIADIDGGETYAVDGDRVALGQTQSERALDPQRRTGVVAVERRDRAEVGDQSREHVLTGDASAISPLPHACGHQQVTADFFAVERQRAQRLGDALDAFALQRVAGGAAAEQQRRQEQAQFVDLAGVEERTGEMRPASTA